jgi:hypothetical protein
MNGHPYLACKVVLATAHGKADAIGPVMKARLGIEVVVPEDLDTDSLGTFSGDVPRPGTIEETLVRKAHLGLEATDLTLAIASEGSYGPHPHIPFLGAGVEQMILIDTIFGHRILESLVEDNPVFENAEIAELAELHPFIERSQFPSHALMVRPTGIQSASTIFKGLRRLEDLQGAVQTCIGVSPQGRALVQSDMRAHMNPTRMQSIARLANRLADRILALCPFCDAPGYGRTGIRKGLPCSECGWPTEMVREEVYGCQACDRTESRPRSDGLIATGPRNCPNCNP